MCVGVAPTIFTGVSRDAYRKSFPAVEGEQHRLRAAMSQSMTDHLDVEAARPHPLTAFRKSRSMKLAAKDLEEGEWPHTLTFLEFSHLTFGCCCCWLFLLVSTVVCALVL